MLKSWPSELSTVVLQLISTAPKWPKIKVNMGLSILFVCVFVIMYFFYIYVSLFFVHMMALQNR